MNVLVTITAPSARFPAGTPDEDHYIYQLGELEQMEPLGPPLDSLFEAVPPGEYIPRCSLRAADGTMIGGWVAGEPITVPPDDEVDRHPPATVVATLE